MGPVHTLHEFAMNLLSDAQALADFNADPAGVLDAAGLGDVSVADVHEILPLVMDTVPAPVSDSLNSIATGDVAGTLDQAMAGASAAPNLSLPNLSLTDLPNLSGVFGAVSEVAQDTGLNNVTDAVLHAGSEVVDSVATAVDGVPIVGPVLNAGAIDLEHTVSAVGEHLWDGELVGSAADALTNHLGDALLPAAVVDAVSGLPAVGEPLGGLVDDLRLEGAAVLGTVNEAIGTTPVGENSGQILAELGNLTDVQSALGAVTDSVATHAGELPLVGGTVSGVLASATGTLSEFGVTGDVSDTLDHVTALTSAVPALPAAVPALPAAVPALPALPALPAGVPAVSDVTATVAGHLPLAGDMVNSAASAGLPDVQHEVINTVSDLHVTDVHVTDVSSSATGLVSQVQDHLNVGGVTDGLDHTGGMLDDLNLGLGQ